MMQHADGRMHTRPSIDVSWTLFLDRDGVINRKIDGGYVCNTEQFEWLAGAREAIRQLSSVFGLIIIVTNQQGVGRGLVSESDLNMIHTHLLHGIQAYGGKIDAIYYAPHLAKEGSPMRKPGIGMALAAKNDFPKINLQKSIMVGDSLSDMEFGKQAGMVTVAVSDIESLLVDVSAKSLVDFAQLITSGFLDD